MLITRISMLSGKTHQMDLDVTEEQMMRFKEGELVQNVFPNLSPEEREFILSGSTPEEWDEAFAEYSELEDEDYDFPYEEEGFEEDDEFIDKEVLNYFQRKNTLDYDDYDDDYLPF